MIDTDTLLVEYTGRRYRVFCTARDAVTGEKTVVLVEDIMGAVLRNRVSPHARVLTLPVAAIAESVLVDSDPTGGGQHRKHVPRFKVLS